MYVDRVSLKWELLMCITILRVNDDGAGDGRNALIVERLMPDRDYYVQFQTFHPQGGKFEFVITAW